MKRLHHRPGQQQIGPDVRARAVCPSSTGRVQSCCSLVLSCSVWSLGWCHKSLRSHGTCAGLMTQDELVQYARCKKPCRGLQGCAGIAAVVLPLVGLDCASVKEAVQRVEAAATARSKDGARVSLLHMAVRSCSTALVRPARVTCTGWLGCSRLAPVGTSCTALHGLPGCGRVLTNLPWSMFSECVKRVAFTCGYSYHCVHGLI